MSEDVFYNELLYPAIGQRLRMDKTLFESNTGLQQLVIFENEIAGRVMALDGVVQTTTSDEFVYHEMLAHLPVLAHGHAKHVLIIGGGDGGMLRRCLQHKGIEKVTMVEIDQSVVDMSKEWLPQISNGAFDNPRAHIVIDDGCKFVKNTTDKFDVIIVDSTDPIGPGAVLFTQEFYADCKTCLSDGGIIVTQNGVPVFQPEELRNTHTRLGNLFKDTTFFVAPVPTYYGGFMAFGWATDNVSLRAQTVDVIQSRFDQAGIQTDYYNPDIHLGAFALPQFIKNILKNSD